MKKVTILGSTGSIGENSLAVIRGNKGLFRAIGLSTNVNTQKLNLQISEFMPRIVVVADNKGVDEIAKRNGLIVWAGADRLSDLAQDNSDILINALVGSVGIRPTVMAARKGKVIALANKESLVAAGDLINSTLASSHGRIIPVDSEHSAIFQCLLNTHPSEVEKIIITASGGPFRRTTKSMLRRVTAVQALKHPTWNMGAKITIDSATMMNKGLEVIEAHFLFNVPYEKIEVVIHPQSIVHSMVQFIDGSVMAHLGHPDMKMPIQYALTFPGKAALSGKRLDFSELGHLYFEKPDFRKFPCLELAYAAGKEGGSMPAVMSAANEIAVEGFLAGRLGFMKIPKLVEKAMGLHKTLKKYSLEDILDTDVQTRNRVKTWVY